ncbi:hypothetical protein MD484_g5325, partial [Candolleomyces efflorescens]
MSSAHSTRFRSRRGCPQPRNALDRKRAKVLHYSQNGLGSPSEEINAIARFILDERDSGLVDHLLAPFVDVHPGGSGQECGIENLDAVTSSIAHLIAVFGAFTTDFRDSLEPYKSAAFVSLSEKWPTVITWLKFLLIRVLKTKDEPGTMRNCAGFLKATLSTFQETGRAEEIFSLPCTIDLVYILVCRAKVYPEEVHPFAPIMATLGVFRLCLDPSYPTGGVTASSFALRLNTVTESTRTTIISTLVRRAKNLTRSHLLDSRILLESQRCIPRCLQALAHCIDGLLQANPSLWKTFADQRLVLTFTQSLNYIVNLAMSIGMKDQEFWFNMSQAIVDFIAQILLKHSPNRRYSLSVATEAGLMKGSIVCLLRFDRSGYPGRSSHLKDKVKEIVQAYYLSSSRIVRGFSNVYPVQLMDDMRVYRPDLRDVHDLVKKSLYQGLAVFDDLRRQGINMCDNLEHHNRAGTLVSPSDKDGKQDLKTCGRCRYATYCSAECQHEDWKLLHRNECAGHWSSYAAQKARNIWEPVSARRDELAYMEAVLNTHKSFPETWTHSSSGPDDREPVLVLDFIYYDIPTQHILTIDECWKHIWDRTVDSHVCRARIEAMVEKAMRSRRMSADAESGPGERFRLVLGIFFHDVVHATILLALVSSEQPNDESEKGDDDDDGDSKKGDRTPFYRIVNSVMCLCDISIAGVDGLWKDRGEPTPVTAPQEPDERIYNLDP